jgi:hypothetical protein
MRLILPDIQHIRAGEWAAVESLMQAYFLKLKNGDTDKAFLLLSKACLSLARPSTLLTRFRGKGKDCRRAYDATWIKNHVNKIKQSDTDLGVFLFWYLSIKDRLNYLYPSAFESSGKKSKGTISMAVNPAAWLDVLYNLAGAGLLGTFEQVCNTSLSIVLQYLSLKAKENASK